MSGKISAGGLSRGSSLRGPRSQDPHQHQQTFSINLSTTKRFLFQNSIRILPSMRAGFLFILFSHVNEIVCAKQKHIGSSWSDLQHGHSEQSSGQLNQGKGPSSQEWSIEKRDVSGSAGTYWSSLPIRHFRSDEDDPEFRNQGNNGDLIPEKVKGKTMPVGNKNQTLTRSG